MSSELMPCPFCCGGSCRIRQHGGPFTDCESYAAACPCGYESKWYDLRRQAVAAHNKVSAAVHGGSGKK